jgi:hypothetical protein
MSLAERFWSKVKKTPTCWLWYGNIGAGDKSNYKLSNTTT